MLGSELLLTVVFEPDQAGGIVAIPGIEHADQDDIVVSIAVEVADRSGMSATQTADAVHLERPVAIVPEPETTVVGLGVGVGVLEVVTDGDQQVDIAIVVEVGGDHPRAADVEIQPLVE